jgi:hypothetical protein
MSTWHQDKQRQRLYDKTRWTILENPPNQPMSCTLFDTEAAARTTLALWRANGKEHLTLLRPAN